MKNEALLAHARERFQRAVDAEQDIRAEALIDLKFVAGDQWHPTLKAQRERGDRPALVFNKLTGPIQSIANEVRQNKPGIKVHPVDSGATKETAEVVQGIIRHIEYASSADRAYETALDSAVSCSFGYFRLLTRYMHEESFDQDITIETITDPFSVYMDCDCKQADRSDAKWAFVVMSYSREEYKARFGESEAATTDFWGGHADAGDWIADSVRVAEYWAVETTSRKLQMLSDGRTVWSDEVGKLPKGVRVEKERPVDVPQVKQYIINGAEVLEENDWAGKYIPIIGVYGKEMVIEGKRVIQSLIRQARDAQRLHNYYKTTEAETIALVPKPKWVGYVGQFKTKAKDWQTANNSTSAFLEADPLTVAGQIAPLPRWESFEGPIQALSGASLQSADDIKAATNIYDASLGARSNETSGVAIRQRENQGDVSNFHFIDNLTRSQTHLGRILIDLIPKIYDTPREIRILGPDEQEKVVMVNQTYLDPETRQPTTHMLDAGRFDCTVSTGPSYSTKRQEAFDMLQELSKAYPQLIQIAGDIIFQNSDMPGADAIAERLKAQNGQAPVPPQLQAHLAQLGQQNQAMQQELQKLLQERNGKLLEIQSKERIAFMQTKAQVILGLTKVNAADAQQKADQEFAQLSQMMDQAHDAGMQAADQAHQRVQTIALKRDSSAAMMQPPPQQQPAPPQPQAA